MARGFELGADAVGFLYQQTKSVFDQLFENTEMTGLIRFSDLESVERTHKNLNETIHGNRAFTIEFGKKGGISGAVYFVITTSKDGYAVNAITISGIKPAPENFKSLDRKDGNYEFYKSFLVTNDEGEIKKQATVIATLLFAMLSLA